MDWLRRNPVIALLALLAAALAGVLALELGLGGPSAPAGPARRPVPAEVKLMPQMVATAPEQAYPEAAARPLFSPTRRPAPAVVATPQPTFQRGQFALLGVIVVGDHRIAMLRERSNGRVHRVEKGRDVNGIKVADIQAESVTLAMGAEQESVPLVVGKAGGAPGQPGAPPNFPQPPGAPAPSSAAPQGPFAQPPNPAAAAPAAPMRSAPFPANAQPVAPGTAPAPGANPPNTGAPQPSQAPMTPEELLERRRARRAQQTQ
jgi:general secretion pathway protein N